MSDVGKDLLIRSGLWVIALAPIWMSVLLFRFPVALARRVRQICKVVALSTVSFMFYNLSDRSPWKWAAGLAVMAGGWLVLSAELAFRLTRDYHAARQR